MSLDSKLKTTCAELEKLEKNYPLKANAQQQVQQKAREKLYSDKDAAEKMLAVEHLDRQATAFHPILAATQAMGKGEPVSAKALFSVLAGKVQLFPRLATVEEMKEQFMLSAHGGFICDDEVIENDYEKKVSELWDKMQPYAETVATRTYIVQAAVLNEIKEVLKKKVPHQARPQQPRK